MKITAFSFYYSNDDNLSEREIYEKCLKYFDIRLAFVVKTEGVNACFAVAASILDQNGMPKCYNDYNKHRMVQHQIYHIEDISYNDLDKYCDEFFDAYLTLTDEARNER